MRTQQIRDNLEAVKKELKFHEGNEVSKSSETAIAYCTAEWDTTLKENIKEAESMIFELENDLRDWTSKSTKEMERAMDIGACHQPYKPYRDKVEKRKKKLKDWQNLLNWLRGLKWIQQNT